MGDNPGRVLLPAALIGGAIAAPYAWPAIKGAFGAGGAGATAASEGAALMGAVPGFMEGGAVAMPDGQLAWGAVPDVASAVKDKPAFDLRDSLTNTALAGSVGSAVGSLVPETKPIALQPPGLPGVPVRPGGFQSTTKNPMEALAQQIAQRRAGMRQAKFA